MDYSGMTVNERLFVSGKNKAFDKAIKNKNREEVFIILRALDIDEESILKILNTYGILSSTDGGSVSQ